MSRKAESVWLMPEVVLALHERMIAEFGGAPGLRVEGLLSSALDRARNLAAYGKPTLFDLAAAYAYGLGKNHPFNDGNKRICLWAAVAFLKRNELEFKGSESEAVVKTLALVTDGINERDYADWLRCCCQ